MTGIEMIQAFKVGYDIVNLEGPGYEDSEIYVLLNQAQDLEVLKEVFVRRWAFVSNLIVNETGSVSAGLSYSNTKSYTAQEEYLGYISSKSKVTRANFKIFASQWVENIPIAKELSGKYVTNDVNRPILIQPRVYEDTAESITIIYDSNTTFAASNNFILEYVRKPLDISGTQDSEVNIALHERIVDTAVNLAKKVFNPSESSGSVQTDAMINKMM